MGESVIWQDIALLGCICTHLWLVKIRYHPLRQYPPVLHSHPLNYIHVYLCVCVFFSMHIPQAQEFLAARDHLSAKTNAKTSLYLNICGFTTFIISWMIVGGFLLVHYLVVVPHNQSLNEWLPPLTNLSFVLTKFICCRCTCQLYHTVCKVWLLFFIVSIGFWFQWFLLHDIFVNVGDTPVIKWKNEYFIVL